jgi:hypothetical protein
MLFVLCKFVYFHLSVWTLHRVTCFLGCFFYYVMITTEVKTVTSCIVIVSYTSYVLISFSLDAHPFTHKKNSEWRDMIFLYEETEIQLWFISSVSQTVREGPGTDSHVFSFHVFFTTLVQNPKFNIKELPLELSCKSLEDEAFLPQA